MQKNGVKTFWRILLAFAAVLSFLACGGPSGGTAGVPEQTIPDLVRIEEPEEQKEAGDAQETGSEPESALDTGTTEPELLDPDGAYTTEADVAEYLYTYGHLPSNFITKSEARRLGWEGGSLEPYAPGMCIGGDYFGNYEGLLPEKEGREYRECDIDTLGARSRGAKRIIYSSDGLIYYTEDHYESFVLLYGEE